MQKSAKDIAFEKERARFRSKIRELESSLNARQVQIEELNAKLREKDQVILQQSDWIERLLEYTEMSKEDLHKLIDSEKDKAEIVERLSSAFGAIKLMTGGRNLFP